MIRRRRNKFRTCAATRNNNSQSSGCFLSPRFLNETCPSNLSYSTKSLGCGSLFHTARSCPRTWFLWVACSRPCFSEENLRSSCLRVASFCDLATRSVRTSLSRRACAYVCCWNALEPNNESQELKNHHDRKRQQHKLDNCFSHTNIYLH